jgi:hypothetical protein
MSGHTIYRASDAWVLTALSIAIVQDDIPKVIRLVTENATDLSSYPKIRIKEKCLIEFCVSVEMTTTLLDLGLPRYQAYQAALKCKDGVRDFLLKMQAEEEAILYNLPIPRDLSRLLALHSFPAKVHV